MKEEPPTQRPRVEIQLPVDAHAPAQARLAVDVLVDWFPEAVLDRVRLLVSEIVTNSVRHAGLGPADQIVLALHVTATGIRVETYDQGPGYAVQPGPPTPDRPSGWGLFLVGALADRWGVDRNGGSRTWFEIDASAPAG